MCADAIKRVVNLLNVCSGYRAYGDSVRVPNDGQLLLREHGYLRAKDERRLRYSPATPRKKRDSKRFTREIL